MNTDQVIENINSNVQDITTTAGGEPSEVTADPANTDFFIENIDKNVKEIVRTLDVEPSEVAADPANTDFFIENIDNNVRLFKDNFDGGGGGGATMFYADLHGVQSNLWIYADSSRSDVVDSDAMIAALSRGPVMIKDINYNNIFVTVVSANDANSPLGIVIDMYDDSDNPARRRFEYNGPDWTENPFN